MTRLYGARITATYRYIYSVRASMRIVRRAHVCPQVHVFAHTHTLRWTIPFSVVHRQQQNSTFFGWCELFFRWRLFLPIFLYFFVTISGERTSLYYDAYFFQGLNVRSPDINYFEFDSSKLYLKRKKKSFCRSPMFIHSLFDSWNAMIQYSTFLMWSCHHWFRISLFCSNGAR